MDRLHPGREKMTQKGYIDDIFIAHIYVLNEKSAIIGNRH